MEILPWMICYAQWRELEFHGALVDDMEARRILQQWEANDFTDREAELFKAGYYADWADATY